MLRILSLQNLPVKFTVRDLLYISLLHFQIVRGGDVLHLSDGALLEAVKSAVELAGIVKPGCLPISNSIWMPCKPTAAIHTVSCAPAIARLMNQRLHRSTS